MPQPSLCVAQLCIHRAELLADVEELLLELAQIGELGALRLAAHSFGAPLLLLHGKQRAVGWREAERELTSRSTGGVRASDLRQHGGR